MKIAVITGASSGLGVEFTKTIIKQYPKLDEIWIIARRKVSAKYCYVTHELRKRKIASTLIFFGGCFAATSI